MFEHRHRFAAWAAARAAQRGFVDSAKLIGALEQCGLREVVREPATWPQGAAEFDEAHVRWCERILVTLNAKPTHHGRAAKLISIYLKAMVITGGHHGSEFAKVIHPPIDRLLLQALSKDERFGAGNRALWRAAAWTTFDARAYLHLIGTLRGEGLDRPAFWMIERYWRAALS